MSVDIYHLIVKTMADLDKEPKHIPLFIRRLMPNASQDELQEAAENWGAYMLVAWHIFEGLKKERKESDSQKP